MRLLIPLGSRLLELDDIRAVAGPFDPRVARVSVAAPGRVDGRAVEARAARGMVGAEARGRRRAIFAEVWDLANERPIENFDLLPRATVPYLDEPWYC